MADVELNVVGQWSRGSLQECSKAFVTKFQKENRQSCVRVIICSQVLDYIWMPG